MKNQRTVEDDNGIRHRVENPEAEDLGSEEFRQREIDAKYMESELAAKNSADADAAELARLREDVAKRLRVVAEDRLKTAAAGAATRDSILQQIHNELCADIDRIKSRFKGKPKVSLIVRFDDPEKGIWLTDDTADSAVEYIRYMEAQNALECK